MKPITFSCEQTLALAPEDIARQILDVTRWPDFNGFGPIPGIKAAEFEVRTPDIVASRITLHLIGVLRARVQGLDAEEMYQLATGAF